MFEAFDSLASGTGVLLTAALAGAIVLIWDWRLALPALVIIQVAVSTLLVAVHAIPTQWAVVQVIILGLCAVMLALSGFQVHVVRGGRHSGSWFFRLAVLLLVGAALRSLGLRVALPLINPQIGLLLGWLAAMALLVLSLGDNPLFTAIGLLLWCSVAQAIATVVTPVGEVIALIGLVQLAVGFTCSYLLVAERLPRLTRRAIISDVSFPPELVAPAGAPPAALPPAQPPLPALLRGRRAGGASGASAGIEGPKGDAP